MDMSGEKLRAYNMAIEEHSINLLEGGPNLLINNHSNWPYNYLHPPFQNHSSSSTLIPPPPADEGEGGKEEEEEEEELGAMKEMMFKMAAMQPVDIDPTTIRKPRRRNVRISDDPQSIAARLRRERISDKIRVLQRLVPGGTKLDTASMLDEAIRYVKFLKRQIRILQANQPPWDYFGLNINNQIGPAGDHF